MNLRDSCRWTTWIQMKGGGFRRSGLHPHLTLVEAIDQALLGASSTGSCYVLVPSDSTEGVFICPNGRMTTAPIERMRDIEEFQKVFRKSYLESIKTTTETRAYIHAVSMVRNYAVNTYPNEDFDWIQAYSFDTSSE